MGGKVMRAFALFLTVCLVLLTAIPVSAAGERSQILNSVELRSRSLTSPTLDQTIERIMNKIITDDMDNAQKLMACYDYVVLNLKQKTAGVQVTIYPGSEEEMLYNRGRRDEVFAKIGLSTKVGCCVEYSCIFAAFARRLGYKATVIEGSTLSAKGGYVVHHWVEIVIDKKTYVFDPFLERTFMGSKSTNIPHTFFCTTYAAQVKRFKKIGVL